MTEPKVDIRIIVIFILGFLSGLLLFIDVYH
jgi:hypothetical protein